MCTVVTPFHMSAVSAVVSRLILSTDTVHGFALPRAWNSLPSECMLQLQCVLDEKRQANLQETAEAMLCEAVWST